MSNSSGSAAKEGLKQRAVSGAVWTVAAQIALQVVRFGGHLVVARILAPDAFGLMLLINTFLLGLQMFTDIGVTASIVQSPDADDQRFLNTAWTLQVARGVILWLLCVALAFPYSAFMDRAALTQLIPAVGVSVLIAGFNSTSLPTMNRHLDLKRLMGFKVGVELVATVTKIGFALVSPTVWALVIGDIARSTVTLVGSHTLFDTPRNRFEIHREFFRVIATFGAWVFFNTLLGYLADYVDRYTLGKVVQDDTLLGCYQVAVNLGGMPYVLLVAVGGSVIFPMMGRSREAGLDLGRVYKRIKLPIFAAGGLAVSGLIATGPWLIRILYKPIFSDAGWMLLPVAASQWFRILAIPPANTMFALGKIYWLAIANAAKVAGFAAFVPVLWHLGGIRLALWGFTLGEALGVVVYAIATTRNGLGVPGRDMAFTLGLGVLAGAGYLLGNHWSAAGMSPIFILLAVGALVALPWSTLAPAVLRELRHARQKPEG